MNHKKIIFSFLFAFFHFNIVYAQILKTPGTAGASFLKINLPARAEAMGGSYCGLADDVSAIYYNPGGLAQIKKTEVQFSNLSWYEGASANSISFAKRNGSGAFGFDLRMFQGEDRVRNLVNGVIVEGEKIGLRDLAVSMCYATSFVTEGSGYDAILDEIGKKKKFGIGFTVKYINEQLYRKQCSAFAMDIGITYTDEDSKDLYGAALQNIGANIGGDSLPVTLRLGSSYKHEEQVISWELTQGIDSTTRISTGAEFKLGDSLCFRIGGFYQDEFGYTAGLGFCLESFQVDYAYVPQESTEIGQTHNVSLILRF